MWWNRAMWVYRADKKGTTKSLRFVDIPANILENISTVTTALLAVTCHVMIYCTLEIRNSSPAKPLDLILASFISSSELILNSHYTKIIPKAHVIFFFNFTFEPFFPIYNCHYEKKVYKKVDILTQKTFSAFYLTSIIKLSYTMSSYFHCFYLELRRR